MSLLRAKLFFVFLFLIMPITILGFLLFPSSKRKVRKITARFFMWLFSMKVKKIGEIDDSAQMIVLNHRSFLDVIYLEAIHPRDLCWIAKKELGDVPFYGLALKLPKMILIDREDKKELIRLLKEAKEALKDNRVLAIFPEGTRNKGDTFLPFKDGAKVIAQKYDLKVQPIVLIKTRELFDNKRLNPNIEATAIFLDTIKIEDGWYDRLREKMQEVYHEYNNNFSNR